MVTTISLKATTNALLLTLAFCVENAFAQPSDFPQVLHKTVVHYSAATPKGDRWEEEKKSLTAHSQEELARALIAEIDIDNHEDGSFYDRDNGIRELYKVLNLPPVFICQELEKSQPPQRKASLMVVLRGQGSPEATAALLRQLKDRRPALATGSAEGLPVYPLRVCDVACKILTENLEPDVHGYRVGASMTDAEKDAAIQEMLNQLHLSIPK